jgi:hypothetical protein
MGRHAPLRAWQAVLEGRKDEPPPFVGYDANPLTTLGSSTQVVISPQKPVLRSFCFERSQDWALLVVDKR